MYSSQCLTKQPNPASDLTRARCFNNHTLTHLPVWQMYTLPQASGMVYTAPVLHAINVVRCFLEQCGFLASMTSEQSRTNLSGAVRSTPRPHFCATYLSRWDTPCTFGIATRLLHFSSSSLAFFPRMPALSSWSSVSATETTVSRG